MLCDFTAGVQVVSFLHVATPEDDDESSPSHPDSDACQCIFSPFPA